jgi:hypothetical protein
MYLQHPATYDIAELSDVVDVSSVSELVKSIKLHALQQDKDFYQPLTYMGDCWEVFCEFFMKFFNGDHTLTYTADYEPNNDYDRGIDGRGVCTLDGQPNVIQCKFKANPQAWLTNDDNISNVAADATLNEGLVPNGKNIIVFTSCQGVHPKHAMASVHCVSLKEIARRVDKNVVFWKSFKDVVTETQSEIKG